MLSDYIGIHAQFLDNWNEFWDESNAPAPSPPPSATKMPGYFFNSDGKYLGKQEGPTPQTSDTKVYVSATVGDRNAKYVGYTWDEFKHRLLWVTGEGGPSSEIRIATAHAIQNQTDLLIAIDEYPGGNSIQNIRMGMEEYKTIAGYEKKNSSDAFFNKLKNALSDTSKLTSSDITSRLKEIFGVMLRAKTEVDGGLLKGGYYLGDASKGGWFWNGTVNYKIQCTAGEDLKARPNRASKAAWEKYWNDGHGMPKFIAPEDLTHAFVYYQPSGKCITSAVFHKPTDSYINKRKQAYPIYDEATKTKIDKSRGVWPDWSGSVVRKVLKELRAANRKRAEEKAKLKKSKQHPVKKAKKKK